VAVFDCRYTRRPQLMFGRKVEPFGVRAALWEPIGCTTLVCGESGRTNWSAAR
jgi:hypothetical protein